MFGAARLGLYASNPASSYTNASYINHVYNAVNSSGRPQISWPRDIAVNDIAILFEFCELGSSTTPPNSPNLPNFFTTIINTVGDPTDLGKRTVIAYKQLTGSESGAINGMTTSGGGTSQIRLIVYRPTFTYSTISYNNNSINYGNTLAGTYASSLTIPLTGASKPYLGFVYGQSLSISYSDPNYNSSTGLDCSYSYIYSGAEIKLWEGTQSTFVDTTQTSQPFGFGGFVAGLRFNFS